jgi:predicted phosphodiesterase
VFGNWDLNRRGLCRAIREIGAVIHGETGRLELGGKRIAWLHGHVRGARLRLEASGEWDFIFYGHSHKPKVHKTGKTLVLNPGALHRAKVKTVAVLDLQEGSYDILGVTAK